MEQAPNTDERPVPQSTALTGEAVLPANRDIALMALAFAARCSGSSRILNCPPHPAVDDFVQNLRRIGVSVGREGKDLVVESAELSASEHPLNTGPSRIHFACLAGLLAAAPFPQGLTYAGDPKEVRPILDALEALDARMQIGTESEGPLTLTLGGRKPKKGPVRLEAVDEAAKAAVFLASLGVKGQVDCYQPSAGDDTIEPLFKAAGSPIEKERVSDEQGYRLTFTGPASPEGVDHELPGDPDASLFLLLTAALLPRSELVVTNAGVDWKSRRVVEVLRWMSAELSIERARTASRFAIRRITAKGSELRSTRIGAELSQLLLDELPFLAIVGACASGEAIFRDANGLRNGGGDALSLTVSALRDMGVKVGEMPDGLIVQGNHVLQGTKLDAGGDARVAVALLLAGMAAEGTTIVTNPGPVDALYGPVLEAVSNVAETRRVEA